MEQRGDAASCGYSNQRECGQEPLLLDFSDGLVDSLGDVVDVLGGEAAHVDAAAGHQVHVLLFDHVLHLFGCSTEKQKGLEEETSCSEEI